MLLLLNEGLSVLLFRQVVENSLDIEEDVEELCLKMHLVQRVEGKEMACVYIGYSLRLGWIDTKGFRRRSKRKADGWIRN